MKRPLQVVFIVTSFFCLFNFCTINPNILPIINESPTIVKTVPNGQKYVIGDLQDPDRNYIYIANLKGSPYQMGVAYGKLFAIQIKNQLKEFYPHYEKFLEQIFLPKFMIKSLGQNTKAKIIMKIADLNIYVTKRYVNHRIHEQMAGIAQGANISLRDLERLNIFPQLVKAACSIVGLWKSATNQKNTLHLRALDWDANAPINRYPLIVIYHPNQAGLQVHANLGWAGFIGTLTGLSRNISLGEKVWEVNSAAQKPKQTRYGNPWMYVFRDLLYEATSLRSAISILQKAHRTCSIFMGIGSPVQHSFRTLQYSQKILNIYDDKNYTHYIDKIHPQSPGTAYFDKKLQPSKDDCLGMIINHKQYYGEWDMEKMWRIIGNSHKTGDTQLVAFNLETQEALVSYSLPKEISGFDETVAAYSRHPIYINFNQFWNNF